MCTCVSVFERECVQKFLENASKMNGECSACDGACFSFFSFFFFGKLLRRCSDSFTQAFQVRLQTLCWEYYCAPGPRSIISRGNIRRTDSFVRLRLDQPRIDWKSLFFFVYRFLILEWNDKHMLKLRGNSRAKLTLRYCKLPRKNIHEKFC